MENNLESLNDTLFDTLKSLKNGSIDEKRANSIVNIANTIVKNTSVQLSAFKMAKGQLKVPKSVTEKKVYLKINSNNLYDQKKEFASSLGYKGISEAIDKLGKKGFEDSFNENYKVA